MENICSTAATGGPDVRTSISKGFVRLAHGNFYIDRSDKLGSLIANEVILREMVRFLRSNFDGVKRGRLLDVGAGTKPYVVVYQRHFEHCVSVDVPSSEHDPDIDFFALADDLPFESGTYDCIVCTEVLEHVPDPRKTLAEFYRVLAPGGLAFVTTPFLVQLHEMPYDFYRYTPSALRTMAGDSKFEVESITSRGDYFSVLLANLSFPLQKFWGFASRLTRVQLYSPKNPFVWLGIVMPQLLYLRYWQTARDGSKLIRKIYKTLDYFTLGYVTVLRKP